ncbi:MAG: YbaB/EbfC family nucleoid-associated protein [Actinomycetota bacterium]|nr:YbaB/EbfC family nucleoid-associated protein [Actinomycetota bacterium]MDH4353671.1 YbaB/EbfC family nucleoid-associated protein [Actinomycetota bacterium]
MTDLPDLSGLLAQAQQMMDQHFEGSAGGGLVELTVTGSLQLVDVHIKPEAADPDDTETLAALVLAAYRDASEKAGEALGALGLPGM